MNPVCHGCRAEMVCDKNGVQVSPSPFTFIRADRFRCPTCGTMVCVNFASEVTHDTTSSTEVVELRR
jgi:hypothetical protein